MVILSSASYEFDFIRYCFETLNDDFPESASAELGACLFLYKTPQSQRQTSSDSN